MALAETLKKSLGLPETANEDDIVKALAEGMRNDFKGTESTDTKNGNGTVEGVEKNPVEDQFHRAVKGLRETSTEIQFREMTEHIRTLRDEKERLEASLRLSDANTAVQQLSEGKGYVLPVPAQEKLLQILIKAPKSLSEEIVQLFAEVKQKGLVELEERGRLRPENDILNTDDPVKMFTQGVERRMSESHLTYVDAVHQLASDNPALYKAYRNATFIEGQVR